MLDYPHWSYEQSDEIRTLLREELRLLEQDYKADMRRLRKHGV